MKRIDALATQHIKNYAAQNGLSNDLSYACDEFGISAVEHLAEEQYHDFVLTLMELRKENLRLKRI